MRLYWVFLILVSIRGVNSNAQISKDTLNTVTAIFHAEYDQELSKRNETFIVNPPPNAKLENFWWEQRTPRAAYAAYWDRDSKILFHYLYIMGGYADLKVMNQDFLVATLCHELGHGLGGPPLKAYKNEPTTLSVEGQADYYAFKECLPRIFKRLPPDRTIRPLNANTDLICKNQYPNNYSYCTRVFQTLESERNFFRLNPTDPDTGYSTPDKSEVKTVNTAPDFYPSSQCRLDTMMAGFLKKDRPRCWFVP